jgi:two-component system nitrogen regulation response regulator NtrX
MCPDPVISDMEVHAFLNPGMVPAPGSEQTHDQNGLLPYLAPDFREAKKSFERHYLQLKLLENEGNISQTAEQIGLERSHLHKKLKSLFLINET